ncbi:uncharacterized protein LOC129763058 [Toxorhynchites rutilus septentrionalis]|uniref:uncharacterized protein LOC129763058 n=1 Tax=Toxorhynchites rutilus septentrionalis TaxID=329112 RepID=UPI00247A234C|nr:uncharacterized protein LOC129763058 [Toxorhynchites rutilus septentrionalis]
MSAWSRPPTVNYPRVWHTFQARDLEGDRMVTYRIEDLPENRVEDAITHMRNIFLRDEPMCGSVGLYKDPIGLEEFGQMWRNIAAQKCAIVCFREGSDDIAGLNMLTVVSKDANKDYKFKSEPLRLVYEAYVGLVKQANIFERYGVDHYLSAWGLSVHPNYRGRGIATELLRARIPICKAMGLTLSVTLFSNPGSQIPAAKVGFFDEIVVTYKQLEEQGYYFPGFSCELNKLMTLKVE